MSFNLKTLSRLTFGGILFFLVAFVPLSLALSLGKVNVYSRLNAPLLAEIDIHDPTTKELITFNAEIPKPEVFFSYGLVWLDFLATVSVSVAQNSAGTNVLRIKTTAPVTKSAVSILVSSSWGGPQVLRKFELLIQPPLVISSSPPISMDSVSFARAPMVDPSIESQTSSKSASTSAVKLITSQGGPVIAALVGHSHIVRQGDTLIALARAVSAQTHEPLSISMAGLYQSNPQAFSGGMMDALLIGAVLRMPVPLAPMPALSAAIPTKADSPLMTTEALQQRMQSLEQDLAESSRLLSLRSAELARLQSMSTPKPFEYTDDIYFVFHDLLRNFWWAVVSGIVLLGILITVLRNKIRQKYKFNLGSVGTISNKADSLHPSTSAGDLLEVPMRMPLNSLSQLTELDSETESEIEDIQGDAPLLDAMTNRIDLARAYIEMKDFIAARAQLEQVLLSDIADQKEEAQQLLNSFKA